MMLEDAPTPEDRVLEASGIKVYVDGQSVDLLQGAQIDYVDTLMGAGFTVNNPNAVSACGCGPLHRRSAGSAGACTTSPAEVTRMIALSAPPARPGASAFLYRAGRRSAGAQPPARPDGLGEAINWGASRLRHDSNWKAPRGLDVPPAVRRVGRLSSDPRARSSTARVRLRHWRGQAAQRQALALIASPRRGRRQHAAPVEGRVFLQKAKASEVAREAAASSPPRP
jgi:iron-sulfur cluster assembly protein